MTGASSGMGVASPRPFDEERTDENERKDRNGNQAKRPTAAAGKTAEARRSASTARGPRARRRHRKQRLGAGAAPSKAAAPRRVSTRPLKKTQSDAAAGFRSTWRIKYLKELVLKRAMDAIGGSPLKQTGALAVEK